MSTCMQQNNGSSDSIFKEFEHGWDVGPSGFGVVVGVLDEFEVAVVDDVFVVEPSGVGDINKSWQICF